MQKGSSCYSKSIMAEASTASEVPGDATDPDDDEDLFCADDDPPTATEVAPPPVATTPVVSTPVMKRDPGAPTLESRGGQGTGPDSSLENPGTVKNEGAGDLAAVKAGDVGSMAAVKSEGRCICPGTTTRAENSSIPGS